MVNVAVRGAAGSSALAGAASATDAAIAAVAARPRMIFFKMCVSF